MENGAINLITICGSLPIFLLLILEGSKSGGKLSRWQSQHEV